MRNSSGAGHRRSWPGWLLSGMLLGIGMSSAMAQDPTAGAVTEHRRTPEEEYALAVRHLRGEGVPRDPVQALAWFRRAAERGYAPAQRELGNAYYAGRGGIERNPALAVEWYRRAAAGGDALAAFNLGRILERGRAGKADPAAAARYYRQAAEAGLAKARTNLGILFYTGRGVPRDLARAFALFRSAAAQGDPLAAYNAGVMAQHGRGTRRDIAAAAKFYRIAAEGDHVDGQLALGRLLARYGKGAKAAAKALFWFEVARLRSEDGRGGVSARERRAVRQRLSAAEIEEVERAAREWRP